MYDTRARRNILIVYSIFFGVITILWILAKPNLNIVFRFPYTALNQLSGLWAVSLISLNLLLASRAKFFENLFGGLDKVYRQHRLTGNLAFAFMLAHPSFLFLGSTNLARTFQIYILSFSDTAYNYGKFALLLFVILICLTIFVKLPYHIWRRTHQLMIIPVIFVLLHVATVHSDVGIFPPLGLWTFGLLTAGIISYVYKIILYPSIGPKHKYKIQSVNIKGLITEVLLEPTEKELFFEPGQFVFVVFDSKAVGTEEHPFSISSSPSSKTIRLSMKQSGDFTKTLPTLKNEESVTLYGPYGQFGKRALSSKNEVLMVAGGIGITPFLSIVNYIKDKNIDLNYKLIYSHKEGDSPYKDEVSKVCGKKAIIYNSDKEGHLSAKIIQDKIGPLQNKLVLLCGPKGMMHALTKQFVNMGVKRRNIIFEDFDLKG